MEKISLCKKISGALSLLLLTGCAEFNTGWNAYPNQYASDPYAQSDFDELLAFGANMANISSSSRSEVCRLLLNRQNGPPGTGVWLHLMVGRLLSDSCGDIPRILDGINTIPPGSLPDQRLQKLVDIHTETLKRMNTVSRKSASVSRKQKTVKSMQETKESTGPKESTESKNDETRLLREKLEAIRSMEKHMDESGGGN
ncbi:MAG: hypothetical protein ACXWT1_19330 [Methylobacter sp.]